MKNRLYLCFVLLALILLPAVLQAQQNTQKFALVIGNGAYTNISRLNNPVNDANDIEAALRTLGFTVEKVINGNRIQMETAIINFRQRLVSSRSSYGFFFYAGHGVQSSNGENYLIPVDANIPSENLLGDRAVPLQWILAELNNASNELNIVVLDSCRDNPFSWNRSGTRGLAVVSRAPPGSIIFYATSDGRPASDGTGRNGLFTGHLLENIKTSGLEVTEVFRRTGAAVRQASGGTQIPAIYNQFFGTAYLGSRPTPAPRPTPVPVQLPAPTSSVAARDNMVRIEGGTFTMGSPVSEPGRYSDETQHQVTVSSFYMSKYQVTQKEWYDVMGTTIEQQRVLKEGVRLHGSGDNHPMYYISWLDAIEYCNRLSLREGLTPVYRGSGSNITCDWTANGYRLPTEAEWEYAAKGGNSGLIYIYSGSNNANAVAWYADNSGRGTNPVGTKAPNSLGLYDMSGNVWEMCWDFVGVYPSGAQTNPRGNIQRTTGRVSRGGSWSDSARLVRSANRGTHDNIYYMINKEGFRVVRN